MQPTPLFYASSLKKRILKSLAAYYCLTIKDLARLIYSESSETRQASLRRCLGVLDRDRFIHRISYRPDDYAGRGSLPLACGLSGQGVLWAFENCAWTDPKELIKDHSPLTLEHEIKRARFHIKVVRLCSEHRLDLYWKKTDLNHTVNPDDVFAIRSGSSIRYYFFELENRRKSFAELQAKYERYDNYYDTDRCKEEWEDFRTFTVVTQIRSEEARQNVLKWLAGEEVTEFRNGRGRRMRNAHPIRRSNFWFSIEPDPLVFLTPNDTGHPFFLFP